MAFQVYPDEAGNNHDHPLSIAAGTSSGLKPIGPLPGSGQKFIRIAMLASGLDPTISLQANSGVEVPIPSDGFTHSVFTPQGADAGDAQLAPAVNGVYLLTIFLNAPATWNLRINNNDVAAHGFTWVVADTDDESRQPWINTAPTGSFNVFSGQADTFAVHVTNSGTGDANMIAGAAPGPGFVVTTVPAPIPPNGAGDVVITYTGAAAPGQVSAVYTATADGSKPDSTVIPGSSAHNNQVTLTAVTRLIEAVFLVDASGSMAYRPDGTSPNFPDQTRWAKLKAGATQSWGLLAGFAANKGKFGVAEFPDITTGAFPAPSPSSKVLLPASDISNANIATAQSALDAHTPVQNGGATPMGHGLGTAVGTVPGNFGLFQGTPDAKNFNERFLILQSDGANNSGPPNPGDFYPPGAAPGNSFANKKIKVIAVGYGKPGTPFEVDNTLLQTLATNSVGGGYFLNADADDSGMALRKQFRQAIVDGLHLDPTVDPHGFLTASHPEARYEISVLPFDTKVAFVVDWVTRGAPVHVSLVTPLCEVITETSAAGNPHIFFRTDPFHRMFVFDDAFLRNDAAPARPRYGAWTLIITYAEPGVLEKNHAEEYQYEVITQSRLRMKVQFSKSRYGTGDKIGVSAALTLDGRGIPHASVMLQVSAPGQSSDNFIARNAVSPDLLARAREVLSKEDVTAVGIKSFALRLKGAAFDAFNNVRAIPMSDPKNTGVYTTAINATSVPGNYEFYVTAVGLTAGGVAFRREQRPNQRVDVVPRSKFTLIDVLYQRERTSVRVFPRDQFGNVILFDPVFNPRIALLVKGGGEFTGPMTFNGDGSYTRTLVYPPTANPVIRVQIDGVDVVPSFPLVPIARLVWVDEVVKFCPGHEAKQGINTHNKPEAALGDVSAKPLDVFVSLGGFGSLTVGIRGYEILPQGQDDVTVFVAPDESLRPYLVEASSDGRAHWAPLGTSPGVTQSFSLGKLSVACAIRISDQSGRIRDNDQNPLKTPGVSIRGVGVRKTKKRG